MLDVYVKPGVRFTKVGGLFDGRLVVAVAEPATEGRANRAVEAALAAALGLPRSQVRVTGGAASRRKRVQIQAAPELVSERLDLLRRG